jgi:RND family efflux transporter MFP subunit
VHQPNMSKTSVAAAEHEAAFDAFDEGAHELDAISSGRDPAGGADEHGHVAISTRYARLTGGRLGLFVGLLAAALMSGFFVVQHLKHGEEASLREQAALRVQQAPPVEVVRVETVSPSHALILPGETRGWYSSTIYARVTGYVAKWLVDIGDTVKKDQVMAIIDTPDLDAQLQAAQAQLEASEAEAKVKESDVDFAKTTNARWQTSPKGAVSEQEREEKKAHYESSIAQLNAARARINLDRANVNRLTYLTRFKEVTAPYDSVITGRHIDIGDLVMAGSTNTTSLFGVAQYDSIRVFANVPQSARVDVQVGQRAQISAGELPGRIFEGTVTRTSRSADPKARTLLVEIDLHNDDGALVPGIYVQVAFNVQAKASVYVPASAMLFRGGGPQVAVINEDDTVKFQDVRIARDDGKIVEIASGIAAGDRVALNISNQIIAGEKVSVREIPADSPNTTK